jgi:hypothetical protein
MTDRHCSAKSPNESQQERNPMNTATQRWIYRATDGHEIWDIGQLDPQTKRALDREVERGNLTKVLPRPSSLGLEENPMTYATQHAAASEAEQMNYNLSADDMERGCYIAARAVWFGADPNCGWRVRWLAF